MEWIKKEDNFKVPVKSWCRDIEDGALSQAIDLAKHPAVFHHVSIMPDCHQGYGMPIGGVIACENTVIPNAVGVDIGCGMGAVKTDVPAYEVSKNYSERSSSLLRKKFHAGKGMPIKKLKNGKV